MAWPPKPKPKAKKDPYPTLVPRDNASAERHYRTSARERGINVDELDKLNSNTPQGKAKMKRIYAFEDEYIEKMQKRRENLRKKNGK